MPDLAFEDARIESCDLQLGDTWRGTQGKMSVTAPVKKIRKKSDNKPQSQINKCHNEKRRRELENETINQLEELLGTCLAEVKQPDKNGIVREATRQIQEVLKRRRECPGECPLRIAQSLSPVQAGEVSSTQSQPPPAGLQYTELTTLIEALKHYTGSLGWVLLEINSKGEIECVTENIRDLIHQDRTQLYKKSIFSIVHASDHAKLRPLLRNIQSFGWGSGDIEKFHAIQAHLIQNPNGIDGAGYVEVLIHAAPVRGPSSEEAGSVMCVIRRCEDASAALLPVDGGPPAITANPSDNIVFRLDSSFTVLSCDLSGLENINSISLVGTRYLELVESSDRLRVETHLQKAVCHPAPPSISAPFRLRIAPDRPWIRVSARSRLFRAKPTSHEPDFIMSTHTVLSDDDVNLLETNAAQLPVGGPLMTSVANGESSTCDTRFRPSMSPADPQFSINEGFEIDGWPFSLDEMPGEESKERKDSTSEGPPTPLTPRTPTTPGDVPSVSAGGEEPNRLRSLLSKKPTPTGESATNSNNRILKDLLKQEDEEATSGETSAPHTPLTPHTPHTPHTPASALSPLHTAQAQAHPHPRPPPHPPHPPHAPHASHAPHQPYPPSAQHPLQQTHHNNSDMLLRVILNEKSDDDAVDSRRNSTDSGRGTSQPSALLTQLLSSSNGPSSNGRSQDGNDNYLERIAGVKRKFEEAKGATPNAKRTTPETQQVTSSAASAASSASSSTATSPATTSSAGMSPLCQKNQILVSLLARQQTTPTLPNPILRAYGPGPRPRHPQPPPQRIHATLSNMLATHSRSSNVNGGTGVVSTAATATAGSAECSTATAGLSAQSQLQMVLQGGARGAYPPPPAPPPHASPALHYANTAPHHIYNNQPPSSSTRPQGGGGGAGDSEIPSDQALSDILDEVIENMPDADRPPPGVGVLLELESNQQLRPDYTGMKEKNAMSAINAIRQSLMQFENSSKSPVCSSPGTPPVYPVQSPGSCNMGSSSGAGGSLYTLGARGEAPADTVRARALVEQHRARLLQMQRSQQMLVPPEAAEQPQSDLGSTINALVSGTPPNVALTRTDYRHLYHPSNQMGSNYGTNKIPSSQQNPMLSRQLSGPGSGGYAHGSSVAAHPAAALHTPLTSQPPYHRQPRPQLGTGSGSGVVSGVGGGATSEYVRNELRAVVGARSARPDMHPHPSLQPPDIDPLMAFDMSTPEYYGSGLGGGGVGGGR